MLQGAHAAWIAFCLQLLLESVYEDNIACGLANMPIRSNLETVMKKIALAAALSLAATTAFAGGVAEPVAEPEVVKAETSSSSGGILVPLLLLVVVAAAVASN